MSVSRSESIIKRFRTLENRQIEFKNFIHTTLEKFEEKTKKKIEDLRQKVSDCQNYYEKEVTDYEQEIQTELDQLKTSLEAEKKVRQHEDEVLIQTFKDDFEK